MPSPLAIILTIAALSAYAAATMASLVALRFSAGRWAAWCLIFLTGGVVLNVSALAIRTAAGYSPLDSGFDVFSLLAALSACVAGYLKLMDRARLAEIVLLPAAGTCLVLGLCLSAKMYRGGFARSVWHAAHLVFSLSGTICFAAAAGAGVIYLRTHKALRRKDPSAFRGHWPSLERLDRFIRHITPVGFALLTASMVVGFWGGFIAERAIWGRTWWKHPKMVLALVAWCLYAVGLHASYARRFRGRRAAVLSIVGLVLVFIVLLVSILMPPSH
jgi:ABC-type uncharacterized transport system permease subunit